MAQARRAGGEQAASAAPAPWTVRYRRWIFAVWVLLALLAAPFAARVTHHLTANGFVAPESAAVWADNQSAALRPFPTAGPTLIQGLAAGRVQALARQSGVPTVWLHPIAGGGDLLLAPSGTPFARTAPFLAAVRAQHGSTTDVTPTQLGNEINRDSRQTLEHATSLALPILLVLLFIVFGSVGSAVLPLIVALFGAELALAVIDLLEAHMTLSVYLTDIATFLALGVGVDYALFISSRFRQALARQEGKGDVGAAVREAMGTSGRSVLFSGLAVALALAMLVLGGTAYWRGLAVGGAVAVASVLLATHTLLPALLGTMGARVEWGRIPGWRTREPGLVVTETDPAGEPDRRGGFWARVARWATRAPALSVLVGVVLLAVPAYEAPQITLRVPANLATMLPTTSPLRRASELEQRLAGPGVVAPIVVALRFPGTVREPATWVAVARVTRGLAALRGVQSVASPAQPQVPPALLATLSGFVGRGSTAGGGGSLSPTQAAALAAMPGAQTLVRDLADFIRPSYDPHLVVLFVTARTGPDQAATRHLVASLTTRVQRWVPSGTRVAIGGTVALLQGFDHYTDARLPWIIGGVAAVAFVVLALATGSLLQAGFGVLLDALVALATAGLLVVTVQHGSLGLMPQPPNMAVTPLIFVLLFGLSMDYEVILLHRMQEALARSGTSGEAARRGLYATGGMITGAGLIMVTVFVVLLTSPLEVLQTLGIGMSAAILLDTWIVRSFLVPGITTLLGRAAFWPWGGRPGAARRLPPSALV